MTAELWLEKRCEHNLINAHDYLFGVVGKVECPGGSRVRLDPDRVVTLNDPDSFAPFFTTVKDIIDALTEQETER